MATAIKIWLTPRDTGVFGTPGLSEASARKVSEVLQHDMENHHVYLNDIEFHNHIVHFMLTIWALGASPETIQLQYDREAKRQRPALPQDESIIKSFSDKEAFMRHLYEEAQYPNYLAFFQREIEAKGVADMINEYLFSGDELAESLLSRFFSGLIHPIIHLGFGIEFNQPAIVAQALAQAAVHEDYLGSSFFSPAEKTALEADEKKTLIEIMDQMRADMKLSTAAHHEDDDRFSEGFLKRAPEVIAHCSQWTVPEDKLHERLAEMMNTAIYWTATAQNPEKEIKLDFFYLHSVNSAILFKAFMDLPYLSSHSKSRLLEMKGRMDLLNWASRNMPKPELKDVIDYNVFHDWPEVFAQSCKHPTDDGHLPKYVRAVAYARELCRPYETEARNGFLVKGDMWIRIANMAVDSVGEIPGDMWVRGAGFAEPWAKFGPRK
ncbi:hypothetical protein N8T08_004761 [Aspergillus melleus]|uniref:Uncharacterized protein n=1 Tax=Aspergillus melleus TaxID=138277 RepID=A0ACC3B3I1_9EURO|nr:hypothetical protein N8T08_004761 [Aspergillus melleus]